MGPGHRFVATQPFPRDITTISNAAATKKRTCPTPTVAAAVKRPRNAGPFVEISEDESTDGGTEERTEDSDEQSITEKPPCTHPAATQKNGLSPSNPQARKLDISRLRSLLNKTKGGCGPQSQTQQGVVPNKQPFVSSASVPQRASVTTSHSQTNPSLGYTPARSTLRVGNAKPASIVTKVSRTPTAPGTQMHKPTTTNLARGQVIRSDSNVKSGVQRSSSSRNTALTVNAQGSNRSLIATPTKQTTGAIKIEGDGYIPDITSSTTQAVRKSAPTLTAGNVSARTQGQRCPAPANGRPPKTSTAVASTKTRSHVQPGSTTDANAVRGLNAAQNQQTLESTMTAGAMQPTNRTQIRQRHVAGESVGVKHDKSTLRSQSSIAADMKSRTGLRQPGKFQDPLKASEAQKVPSMSSSASSVADVKEEQSSQPMRQGQCYSSTQNDIMPPERVSGNTVVRSLPLQPSLLSPNASHVSCTLPTTPISASGQPNLVVDIKMEDVSPEYDDSEDVYNLPTVHDISEKAEPYFEYSIFQKMWGSGQDENGVTETEMTQVFTDIHQANAHVQKLFQNTRELYTSHFQLQLMEATNKRDKYDCETHTGVFVSIENPGKTYHVKLWVQRDWVSALANREPGDLAPTPFILKSVFILRLFKLISFPSDASCGDAREDQAPIRIYQPLQRTQVYTTRESANLAAQNVQIEMSHETSSASDVDADTREFNIRELNVKLIALEELHIGDEKCWKSQFQGVGQVADTFELAVDEVRLCGPRNL